MTYGYLSKKKEEYLYYKKAFKMSKVMLGPDDKQTLYYRKQLGKYRKDNPIFNEENILGIIYMEFNGTILKLIMIDYKKDITMKIYGMKINGDFVKSLYIPYSQLKAYFKIKGKIIKAKDVRNENVIEWIANHISLSEENNLLFS